MNYSQDHKAYRDRQQQSKDEAQGCARIAKATDGRERLLLSSVQGYIYRVSRQALT